MSNLTPRARKALNDAKREAVKRGRSFVGTEHLLYAILKSQQGVAYNVLSRLGVDHSDVEADLSSQAEERGEENDPQAAKDLKRVMERAEREASDMGHSYTGTEHILLAIAEVGKGGGTAILEKHGLQAGQIRDEILRELGPSKEEEGSEDERGELQTVGGGGKVGGGRALRSFGRNLTEMAKRGQLDPVIGREEEIERVLQILCRRTKNNPVLAGEAGVGKTAVVEGLAQMIAGGKAPQSMSDKQIISLDIALMVAGTKYRGQFEERIKAVMEEARKNKNVILFLDELHNIVGAGSGEGAMDASNILKPALSRGEIQCIGATTSQEYRKYIEKDAALERRFQLVRVEATGIEDSIRILSGLKETYEKHHGLVIDESAIEDAVRLSDRYISARQLPDKALDLIDEAGAAARIAFGRADSEHEKAREELARIKDRKTKAIREQDFEIASSLREEEIRLNNLLHTERTTSESQERIILTSEDVRKAVSRWTGIPLQKLGTELGKRLLGAEADLTTRVVGQAGACQAVARALRRSVSELKDPERPTGSFLFLGPTGVGKTHLAKQVAGLMFGTPEDIVQVDMSEYMEKHSVSRMIGSPPGYIGHEDGGQLCERVRKKPYSLVLFDEIEKAHPDVVNLLLQILEEGKLTDSQGRRIDFRNCIIIMTSNVGAGSFGKNREIGFGGGGEGAVDDKILEEAKKTFRAEFLNRIDEIVFFHPLSTEALGKIVQIEFSKLAARVRAKRILLNLSPEAEDLVIKRGYDPQYGARPIRRAVEKLLEDPLSEMMMRGEILHDTELVIGVSEGKLTFVPRDGSEVSAGERSLVEMKNHSA
jgi:ATP-dependent Clp protease ATP-binding subunit ClpC